MTQVAKSRVFTSFDFEHDEDLRTLLVGQSRNPNTPFEIVDWSLKEALPGDWKAKVRDRIRRVDKVIVICGEHTDRASGVSAEVRIAREEGKPVYFIKGRPDKACKLPRAAHPRDRIRPWTWTGLSIMLSQPKLKPGMPTPKLQKLPKPRNTLRTPGTRPYRLPSVHITYGGRGKGR